VPSPPTPATEAATPDPSVPDPPAGDPTVDLHSDSLPIYPCSPTLVLSLSLPRSGLPSPSPGQVPSFEASLSRRPTHAEATSPGSDSPAPAHPAPPRILPWPPHLHLPVHGDGIQTRQLHARTEHEVPFEGPVLGAAQLRSLLLHLLLHLSLLQLLAWLPLPATPP